MRRAYDAVVIGAGPAGSACAIGLAGRGKRVLLLDRERFPRDKVCGGCLNPRSLRGLRDLGVEPAGLPLRRLVLHAGKRSARLALYGGMAVSRRTLDAELVATARARGVEVREGTCAELGRVAGETREVLLDHDGSVAARAVVLAAGLACKLPGLEVAVAPGARLGAGALIEELGAALEPGDLHMVTGRGGYVGLVRVESDRLDVAAALDPALVRECGGLAPAVASLVDGTSLPALPREAGWRGTPLLTRTPSRLHAERVLLVGDAAGYVEPFTGEGIAWALAGARALAPLAADWTPATGALWQREHARLVGRTQRTCRLLRHALRYPPLIATAVGLLARAPSLARPLIRAVTLGQTA